ncbi:MAG: DUF922 domain-containing protein [Roseovarius sp.]|uniref:DUF922 domain-containing protein n=1 Tax=Roseovarius sp. TaxID=1486281 RepID=UPI0032EE6910
MRNQSLFWAKTAVLAAILAGSLPALANPTIKESWESYPVDGTSAAEILFQMAIRGPEGYWAYAQWYVRWSGTCEVRVRIEYMMPRHVNPALLDEPLRLSWEKMVGALRRHEAQHGAHEVGAAKELVATDCRDGNAIVARWSEKDRIYDRETDHGRFEGVIFPHPGAVAGPKVSGGGPGEPATEGR